MRVVKAAAVQLSPVLYSRQGTVDKIVHTIHELGRQGVQFARIFRFSSPPIRSLEDAST